MRGDDDLALYSHQDEFCFRNCNTLCVSMYVCVFYVLNYILNQCLCIKFKFINFYI